jgi:hypothetical protein
MSAGAVATFFLVGEQVEVVGLGPPLHQLHQLEVAVPPPAHHSHGGLLQLGQALQLHDSDLKAVNSKAEPDRVRPSRLADVRAESSSLHATLLPASWNVIRVKISG